MNYNIKATLICVVCLLFLASCSDSEKEINQPISTNFVSDWDEININSLELINYDTTETRIDLYEYVMLFPDLRDIYINDSICMIFGQNTSITRLDDFSQTIELLNKIGYGDNNIYPAIRACWGTSDSNIFFGTEYGAIFHYNGKTLRAMALDEINYTFQSNWDINSIWGTSADNVYAVSGGGIILHFDGENTWKRIGDFPKNYHFTDIWGYSENDFYIVSGNAVLHYNGSEFEEDSISIAVDNIKKAKIRGDDQGNIFITTPKGQILKKYGTQWLEVYNDSTKVLTDIWINNHRDIYVCGKDGLMLHYDGQNWVEFYLDDYTDFTAIDGNDEYVYVVGDHASIYRKKIKNNGLWDF